MELCVLSRISDPTAQLAFYQRALPKLIRDRVSYSHPMPVTIQEWMTRAMEVNHAYLINLEIDEAEGRKRRTPEKTKTVRVTTTNKNTVEVNRLSDAEKTELQSKGLCFRCKKAGHISRNCPSGPRKPANFQKRKVRQVLQEDEEEISEEEEAEEDEEEEQFQIKTIQRNDSKTDF